MAESFSLEELSRRINAWCAEHEIAPASGQAGEVVSERNVRYYRTLGLIDAPEGGGYGEKHLLQLTAVRLLQAQGLPLRRIRELVYGRSLPELREIHRRGLLEAGRASAAVRVSMPVSDELWRAIPLDEDFLLMSCRGTSLTPFQRAAVLLALRTVPAVSALLETKPSEAAPQTTDNGLRDHGPRTKGPRTAGKPADSES
jgi:DNA-binding transcriptional MerR regulator